LEFNCSFQVVKTRVAVCSHDLDSKVNEMLEMAKKLHSVDDPDRESKANKAIRWLKKMIMKPRLVNIFSSLNQSNFVRF